MWEGRWFFMFGWSREEKKQMVIESIQFDQMRSFVDHYSLGSLVKIHKRKPSAQCKNCYCILFEYDGFLCYFTKHKLIVELERLLIEESCIGL